MGLRREWGWGSLSFYMQDNSSGWGSGDGPGGSGAQQQDLVVGGAQGRAQEGISLVLSSRI